MSTTTEPRTFTAATNKLAYAQAFSRSTLAHREEIATPRAGHRRISLLHRRAPRNTAAR